MKSIEKINLEISHIEYVKSILNDQLAAMKQARDEQREDEYVKDQKTKNLAEFFLSRGLYISDLKTEKRSKYYDLAKKVWKLREVLVPFIKVLSKNKKPSLVYKTDKLNADEINRIRQFYESLVTEDWGTFELLDGAFKINTSFSNEQRMFLQSGWSEEISIYLIDKTLKEFTKTRKLKHKLFWNVELRYMEPRCNKQIYTELDLVAQVKDKLYIFEIKCGCNLRIDKWVERANLFQDENTKFITSTALDKLNYMIFTPYWLFTLQEIDEQFTKMLLKDFPD